MHIYFLNKQTMTEIDIDNISEMEKILLEGVKNGEITQKEYEETIKSLQE